MTNEYDRLKEELLRKRKNRSYIIAGIAAVILIAIIIGIVSIKNFFNDPQRDIDAAAKEKYEQAVDYLKVGDYETALKIFDSIDSSWSDYSKVYDKRKEAVKGILQAKIATYIANEDYENLLKFLKKYPEEVDSDKELSDIYNDAAKKYVSNVMSEADAFVKDGDYESATNVLKSASKLVGGSTEITAKLDEIEEATIMSKVQGYEKDKDYVSIIKYLRKVVSDNPEYNDLLDEYYGKYEDITLAKAESLANERKFQDAIDVIQAAQALYNCSEFEATLDGYAECLPKRLVECYEVAGLGAKIGTFTDSFGVEHNDVLFIESPYYERSYATYNLDKKYTNLSGSFVSAKSSGHDLGFSIKIYADNKLIYTSPDMEYTTEETSFSVDITGVKLIKIEVNYGRSWLGPCIIDATVS